MNNINIIKSEKFKTITIKIVLYNEFTKNNATSLSLLSRLLTNTTKKYDTKKKITNMLYDLYDASIYVSCTPSYETSIISFTLTMVNPKFVNDNKLIDKALNFLYQVITNPNIQDNHFDEKVFNEEKKILKDEIDKVYNNKNRYALRQAIKNMCPNEMVSVSSLGTIEELEKITTQSIYQIYKNILETSKVEIYAIGDIDDYFNKKLMKFNNIKSYNRKLNAVDRNLIIPNDIKKIVEQQELNQTKLVMGFRTKYNYADNEFFALQLFCLMFGGLFCSNLFQVVREKYSLAYDVASQLIPDSKIMIVTCGIDSINVDKTINIVIEELKKYQNGEVDMLLLETAKKNAISDMAEIEDSPNAYISFLMKQHLLNQDYSIVDIQNIIENITVEDIIEQSKNVYLDTVYILTNK